MLGVEGSGAACDTRESGLIGQRASEALATALATSSGLAS